MHQFPASNFDVVAFAASAGGLRAFNHLLRLLPADFPAPIVIAQHLSIQPSLPMLVGRDMRLPVAWAEEGARLRGGSVLFVPPDMSMSLDRDHRCRLATSRRAEWNEVPDALFSSIAAVYGDRALGLVLSGTGSAGAAGACAISQRGGLVIAQDEATCDAFGMPSAAIRAGAVRLVLPLEAIARALVALVSAPGGRELFGIARPAVRASGA